MALINCPECGKDVSDKAVACPNCGCPIQLLKNNQICERHINPIVLSTGYMRKTIESTEEEIILTSLLKKKTVISVSDITEIKFCKATFSVLGFLTICTRTGGGLSVESEKDASVDANSIMFNKPLNNTFEEIANSLSQQLNVPLSSLDNSYKAEAKYQYDREQELKRNHVVYCPKCKSENVTYVYKKLSIGRALTGAVIAGSAGAVLGGQSSKKGYCKCLNCGNTWKI